MRSSRHLLGLRETERDQNELRLAKSSIYIWKVKTKKKKTKNNFYTSLKKKKRGKRNNWN